MKYLRKPRQRIDNLRTEERPRKRGRVGRYVYLALLGSVALLLFDVLAGDLVYLRGNGMVTQKISVIAPEYSGTVVSVQVEAGDQVEVGQQVALVRSQQMLKDIARLSAKLLSVEAQVSQLRIRRSSLASLIPAAQRRVKSTEAYRNNIERLNRDGWATAKQSNKTIKDAYGALEELKDLQARVQLLDDELSTLRSSVARAREALENIENLYNQGVLRATAGGIVGTVLTNQGEGFKKGQRLIELFDGPRYVLAYVPVGALYNVEAGDEVVVRYGFHTVPGRIDVRLPLAYRLPQEFQRAFQTVERQQIVRISIHGDLVPPLFTEVEVTWPWSIRAMFARAANSVTALFRSQIGTASAGNRR